MSTQVISTNLVNVPEIISNYGTNATGPISPTVWFTVPASGGYKVQINLSVSVPSSATGDAVVVTVTSIDFSGASFSENIIATPGTGQSTIMHLYMAPGGTITVSASAPSGQVLVSEYATQGTILSF